MYIVLYRDIEKKLHIPFTFAFRLYNMEMSMKNKPSTHHTRYKVNQPFESTNEDASEKLNFKQQRFSQKLQKR